MTFFIAAVQLPPPPQRRGGLGWRRARSVSFTSPSFHTPVPTFPRAAGEGAMA
jgi:hypothetical protein